MTDEKETGGQIPRIENKEQFARWLYEKEPPEDICVMLATRAALRALPSIIHNDGTGGSTPDLINTVSAFFRATAASWITAKSSDVSRELLLGLVFGYKAALSAAKNSNFPISNLMWAAAYSASAASLFCDPSPNHRVFNSNSFNLGSADDDDKKPFSLHLPTETYEAIVEATQAMLLDYQINSLGSGLID